jgi:hypothetical protein
MTDSIHPAALDPEILLRECQVRTGRRGGPGGQHRNKVETAVIVTHEPSGIRAEASERRSQGKNRVEAVRRLRVKLAMEIRTDRSTQVGPSPLLVERTEHGRLRISTDHLDYPALLAETLDWVVVGEYQPADAAKRVGCTTSQLIKFLKREPRAWQWIQQQRSDRDLSPLH